MKSTKLTLKQKKTLIIRIFIIVIVITLASCSAYDLTNTSQVYDYPTPVIKKLAITDDNLEVTIALNMNPNGRDDFKKYLIFATNTTNSFDALTSLPLDDISLITTSSLPFFIAETQRPTFVQESIDDLTHKIPLTIFQKNSNYKIIVLAWGENAKYASSFNNNGWVFSPFSKEATFHYRQEKKEVELYHYSERTNNNYYGFNLQNEQINLVNANVNNDDPLSSNNQLIFYLQENGDVRTGMFFASSGSQITPLGSNDSFSEVITLPTDGYLTSGKYIPINPNKLYAIKNSDGTFIKIYVRSLNLNPSANNNITITLDIAYSIIPNERNF